MDRVYIGIGANLGRPRETIEAAVAVIKGMDCTREHRCSSLYRTAPVGPPGQPDYVNAAISFVTDLSPTELLSRLHAIEADFGRERTIRWGPRTLDLDLLVHGDRIIDDPALTVPHPRIQERGFVLAPLAELAPSLRHPVLHETLGSLYDAWRARTADTEAAVSELP